MRGAGSVETLCGFSGLRCSGDHPQSRLYFAAPPPEEAARKGEPIISNQIHLRRESLKLDIAYKRLSTDVNNFGMAETTSFQGSRDLSIQMLAQDAEHTAQRFGGAPKELIADGERADKFRPHL